MTITNPLGSVRARSTAPAIGPQLALTGALAAVLVVTAVYRPAISDDALLPGMSILFFVLAAAVALLAWQRPLPAKHFSYWDVAGILTLIGIGAAAMVEPDQMVRLVAGAGRNP